MPRKFKRSPLALAILTLLHEAPMHTYKMQKLIKERGKDQVINVGQRASLYQMINQLLREGLVTSWNTEQPDSYPERTVYMLTDKGHKTAVKWLREMVSTPSQEFPEFPAAVSLLPLLTPQDALHQLEVRASHLEAQIAALNAELQNVDEGLDRLFLLESEYLLAVNQAELTWVKSVMDALRSGQMSWTDAWQNPYEPPDADE